MAKRRTVDDQRFVHFLTFSVYHRRRLLDMDQPKKIVLGVLNDQLRQYSARCVGFVIMPNHVHALIWLPEPGNLIPFLSNWKRLSSHAIREWYREHAPNYFQSIDEGEHFWQPKYYAFEIYTAKKLLQKLDYIHSNPIKAKLVERAVDYRWSSARWYAYQQSVGVPIHWIECQ